MPKSSLRRRSGRVFWEGMIRQWRAEGAGPVRAFCRREGVTECSFYSWRRKLAAESRGTGGCSPGAGCRFVPVRLTESVSAAAEAAIEVVLPCGAVVHVPGGADGRTLREVFGALQEVAASHGEERRC